MKNFIQQEFEKAQINFRLMASDEDMNNNLIRAVDVCISAIRSGKKLMFAGNGGSAADAQHWAGELVSKFYFDRPGLPAIALTTDTSILTAIGNDYGYDYTFARQIEALGSEGDVFIAISTSGNSPNIVRACSSAGASGITVIGFTGGRGGKLADLSDICFRVPSEETPRIQEGHEFLGHLLCALIEAGIFGNDSH